MGLVIDPTMEIAASSAESAACMALSMLGALARDIRSSAALMIGSEPRMPWLGV